MIMAKEIENKARGEAYPSSLVLRLAKRVYRKSRENIGESASLSGGEWKPWNRLTSRDREDMMKFSRFCLSAMDSEFPVKDVLTGKIQPAREDFVGRLEQSSPGLDAGLVYDTVCDERNFRVGRIVRNSMESWSPEEFDGKIPPTTIGTPRAEFQRDVMCYCYFCLDSDGNNVSDQDLGKKLFDNGLVPEGRACNGINDICDAIKDLKYISNPFEFKIDDRRLHPGYAMYRIQLLNSEDNEASVTKSQGGKVGL